MINPYILSQRSPGMKEGWGLAEQGLGILIPLPYTVLSGLRPSSICIINSSASFISLVCLSVPSDGTCPLGVWEESAFPSHSWGLCPYLRTHAASCYCPVWSSLMNRCLSFAVSLISLIIFCFHAKLTYFQMLIPSWTLLPDSSSWREIWNWAGGTKMSFW